VKTMYMHTIDGKPASFTDLHGGGIYFVGNRVKAKLVPSLKQIRAEQKIDQAQSPEWANAKLGYVLVEVPDHDYLPEESWTLVRAEIEKEKRRKK